LNIDKLTKCQNSKTSDEFIDDPFRMKFDLFISNDFINDINMSVKIQIKLKPNIQLRKPVSNLLKDRYPHIYQQIHPTKNTNISIDSLTYGSHKTIWWICLKAECDFWSLKSLVVRVKFVSRYLSFPSFTRESVVVFNQH
jgi:hypothetical protein